MTRIDPAAGPVIVERGALRRAATRAASGAALAFLLSQLLNLAVYVVLARLTTPAVFGTFAAGWVLIGLGHMFSDSGMPAAVLQRRDRLEAAAATALISTMVFGVVLAAASLAASPLVGLYFRSTEIGLVAAALSGSLLLNGITGVPGALLQRRLAIRRWLIIEPVAVVSYGVTAAIGLIGGLDVWALVLGWYASSLTRTVGVWIGLGWTPQFRLASFEMWRELSRYARHILASETLRNVAAVAPTAIIGRYVGPRSLGEFRFALQLVTQSIGPVFTGSGYVLQPTLVRVADDAARTRAAVLLALRLLSLVAAPISAFFIPLGEPIALLLFGEEWRGTGPVMMALSGIAFALVLESLASEVFKALERPDILPKMHALLAGLSIVLMASLVPFGVIGVALGLSLSSCIVASYALWRLTGVVGISSRAVVLAITPPLLSAALMAAIVLGFDRAALSFDEEGLLRLLGRIGLDVALGLTVYLVAMTILGRSTLKEMRITLLSMLRMREASRVAENG